MVTLNLFAATVIFLKHFFMQTRKVKQALTAKTYTAQQWAELNKELEQECEYTMYWHQEFDKLKTQYLVLKDKYMAALEYNGDIFKENFKILEKYSFGKN
jgi:hypothetical protein